MAGPIDELFREQQRKVPPASPPPGQWSRIAGGKMVVAGSASGLLTFSGLVVAGCVSFGTLLGGLYLLSSGDDSSIETHAAVPSSAYGEVDTTGAILAPTTFLAPAAAPLSAVPPKPAMATDLPSTATGRPVTAAASFPLSPPPAAATGPEKPDAGGANEAVSGSNSQPPIAHAEPLPSPAVVSSLPPVAFVTVKSEQPQPITTPTLNPANTKMRRPNPPGRWETGLHVTPGLSGRLADVQVYTEERNGTFPWRFDFGDQRVTLYDENQYRQRYQRRLKLDILSFELARQFPNGLRAGLGLAWRPWSRDGLIELGEVVSSELVTGQWASTPIWGRQDVFATIQLDYTFLRRRRFRPYVGVLLLYEAYTELKSQTILYDHRNGNTEVVSTSFAVGDENDNGLYVYPRGGFQYDLTPRLSIGTEIVPGFGIGGRWKW